MSRLRDVILKWFETNAAESGDYVDHAWGGLTAIDGEFNLEELSKHIATDLVAKFIPERAATTEEEVWFEIQVSSKGADDWNATNIKAETIEAVKAKLAKEWHGGVAVGFDFRIVRKNLLTEVWLVKT